MILPLLFQCLLPIVIAIDIAIARTKTHLNNKRHVFLEEEEEESACGRLFSRKQFCWGYQSIYKCC